MAKKSGEAFRFQSLRTQMCLGTILLLGITVGSISYSLILHERNILKNEIERSVILQGRNIALSGEKALLRPDPEFELFPLINKLIQENENIISAVVTDSEGIIQGSNELQDIGKRHRLAHLDASQVESDHLGKEDLLYEDNEYYLFVTPVKGLDLNIGMIYLRYSKESFQLSIIRAVVITLVLAAIVLALGIALSLLLFRHISHPLDILMQGVRKFGEGNLDTKIDITSRNELRLLATSFNEMAQKISSAQSELIAKERLEKELEIAREIQSTLLPRSVKDPNGFEIGHYYQSASEVGGDYLDVIPLNDDKVALVMADVSGKGIPGLVVMAMVKIMVQEFASKGFSPKEVLLRMNSSLSKTIRRNMFVTFFFAVFDIKRSDIVYANAGHNPILLYESEKRKSRFFKMHGLPLGILPEETFAKYLTEYRTAINPGDLLLEYTDGLNEATDKSGSQFRFEGIEKICDEYADKGAKTLVSKLVEAERQFRGSSHQNDDIALLAISSLINKTADPLHAGA
jgi:serine phosphatase RsbU (regulator of sigma subunit)